MALPCALAALTASAAADDLIQPGQWKVTSTTRMNGALTPLQAKARCLTPEQTGDIGKTFGPVSGTVNSDCERAEPELAGRKLQWRLQCKGQMDMDVSANFNFDSPVHYTATIASKAWMAGALISDVKTELEGERVSECQP
jgi:hypothetical protein